MKGFEGLGEGVVGGQFATIRGKLGQKVQLRLVGLFVKFFTNFFID